MFRDKILIYDICLGNLDTVISFMKFSPSPWEFTQALPFETSLGSGFISPSKLNTDILLFLQRYNTWVNAQYNNYFSFSGRILYVSSAANIGLWPVYWLFYTQIWPQIGLYIKYYMTTWL